MTKSRVFDAEPYALPFEPAATALLIIDMQRDFCAADGYMHRLGCDLDQLRAPIEPIRRVLEAARQAGVHVLHTREGYAADLSDLQPWKTAGATNEAIGNPGPLGRALVRGEFGWDFIEELQPLPGEPVYDKTSYGVFATTGIGDDLASRGIDSAILVGLTTDCCITSCLREALDRGIDCMVVEDCVNAASTVRHEAALQIIRSAGGVFGTLGRCEDVVSALNTR